MRVIADSIQNINVPGLDNQQCQLNVDCRLLKCNNTYFTTVLTLSPCDYSVKLKFVHDSGINYEKRFVQSDIETLYINGTSEIKIDVTIARFTGESSIGLQVSRW